MPIRFSREVLEAVAKDYSFLKSREDVLGVFAFPAPASEKVCVCVVAPLANPRELHEFIQKHSPKFPAVLLEEMPSVLLEELTAKAELIFCRDEDELREYLFLVGQKEREKMAAEVVKFFEDYPPYSESELKDRKNELKEIVKKAERKGYITGREEERIGRLLGEFSRVILLERR